MEDESEAPPGHAVVIDTRAVTVKLSGPEATPDAAYALWERVHSALRPGERHSIESGGVGFTAELDVWRE